MNTTIMGIIGVIVFLASAYAAYRALYPSAASIARREKEEAERERLREILVKSQAEHDAQRLAEMKTVAANHPDLVELVLLERAEREKAWAVNFLERFGTSELLAAVAEKTPN